VQSTEDERVEVPEIVKDISIPLKFECKKFRNMWAFGYCFRVASLESRLETQDSGIVATFSRPWRASAKDRNFVEVDVEYIGELEEIVELDYQRTCVVVFVYRWVRANYRGPHAAIKRDKWGFALANFGACQRFGKELLMFPKHCQQVFFSDASELPGWRLVLRRHVRGKRVDNFTVNTESSFLFARGRDDDHEALRLLEIISKDILRRSMRSREIQRENIFQVSPAKEDQYNRDVGESSDSD